MSAQSILSNIKPRPVPSDFPEASWFFLKFALYQSHQLKPQDALPLSHFVTSLHQFDCYCPSCKRSSTFKCAGRNAGSGSGRSPEAPKTIHFDRVFSFEFFCSRNAGHAISLGFSVHNTILTKIAQYPSAADLAVGDILKYEKILGDDAKEFSRALGLFAHGIGIGSFVYLRRIVEKLVEEAHVIAKEQIDWKEEAYASARFSEKVEKLGHLLPTFLCENSSIYSLISRGIHQLTERECLDAFPVLKTSIELILDERLAAIERSEKIEQTKAALAKLKQQHPQAKGGQR